MAVVLLDRPDARNAISGEVAEQLSHAFRAAAESDAWVVILGATGERSFCVGADLKERQQLDDAGWMRNRDRIRELFASLRAIPQPTIASVFGHALGGGFELALSCDLIVCSDDARFGLPEVRVGLVPGGGGTQLLALKAGPSTAKELIFTGRQIDAEEARSLGLVAKVVPRGDLRDATHGLAEEICAASPIAVREAKRAIDRGLDVPLADGIDLEDRAWRTAVDTADRREGVRAFVEKRDPQWRGR